MVAIHAPSTELATPEIPVRTLSSRDLNLSLREGWKEFLSMRGDLIFVGLLYPLIGIVTAAVALGTNFMQLFFPIAAGISLWGPIVAVGVYELARREEAGPEARGDGNALGECGPLGPAQSRCPRRPALPRLLRLPEGTAQAGVP